MGLVWRCHLRGRRVGACVGVSRSSLRYSRKRRSSLRSLTGQMKRWFLRRDKEAGDAGSGEASLHSVKRECGCSTERESVYVERPHALLTVWRVTSAPLPRTIGSTTHNLAYLLTHSAVRSSSSASLLAAGPPLSDCIDVCRSSLSVVMLESPQCHQIRRQESQI